MHTKQTSELTQTKKVNENTREANEPLRSATPTCRVGPLELIAQVARRNCSGRVGQLRLHARSEAQAESARLLEKSAELVDRLRNADEIMERRDEELRLMRATWTKLLPMSL